MADLADLKAAAEDEMAGRLVVIGEQHSPAVILALCEVAEAVRDIEKIDHGVAYPDLARALAALDEALK